MNINFLRTMDRWLGPVLLLALMPVARLAVALLLGKTTPPQTLSAETNRCVFLKLKGGGSLIIALPSLLAMRRKAPRASFDLVCTPEVKVFAELTGLFDRYFIIEDKTPITLLLTGMKALKGAMRADMCIDLEPNSTLSAVFTLLTVASRRVGFVKKGAAYRAHAYTDGIDFDLYAPIYLFYDQLAEKLGGEIPSMETCRELLFERVRKTGKQGDGILTIGIAPFTSDFARERMMPSNVWVTLLRQKIGEEKARLILMGSLQNKKSGEMFAQRLKELLPATVEIINLCGQHDLAETASDILALDECWAIDSGLLHIARMLGVPCRSFWGPTNPSQRLRAIAGYQEMIIYRHFSCSPCVHADTPPPCGGNNLCMISMAEPSPHTNPQWHGKA